MPLKYIIAFLGGLLPEMALSYLFMRLIDGGWEVFIAAYFSIQIFYFSVWLCRTVVSWFLYFLFVKDEIVENFYQILVKGKFPNPVDYHIDDGITYFEDIATNLSDERIEPITLHLASSARAQFKTYESLGQFRMLSQYKRAAKEAIYKYMNLNYPESK